MKRTIRSVPRNSFGGTTLSCFFTFRVSGERWKKTSSLVSFDDFSVFAVLTVPRIRPWGLSQPRVSMAWRVRKDLPKARKAMLSNKFVFPWAFGPIRAKTWFSSRSKSSWS